MENKKSLIAALTVLGLLILTAALVLIDRQTAEPDPAVPATMNVGVYFIRFFESGEEFVRVERSVPYAADAGQAALAELLSGTRPVEEAAGLSSAINEGVELLSLNIENGTAYADFSAELGAGVAGSARVMAIRGQIEQTLLELPAVSAVSISIDGASEEILQP